MFGRSLINETTISPLQRDEQASTRSSTRFFLPFQRNSTGIFRLTDDVIVSNERTIVRRIDAEDRSTFDIVGEVIPRLKRLTEIRRTFQRPNGWSRRIGHSNVNISDVILLTEIDGDVHFLIF